MTSGLLEDQRCAIEHQIQPVQLVSSFRNDALPRLRVEQRHFDDHPISQKRRAFVRAFSPSLFAKSAAVLRTIVEPQDQAIVTGCLSDERTAAIG
jgi:hypothetical protein